MKELEETEEGDKDKSINKVTDRKHVTERRNQISGIENGWNRKKNVVDFYTTTSR